MLINSLSGIDMPSNKTYKV